MRPFNLPTVTALATILSLPALANPDQMIAYVPTQSDATGARMVYEQIIGLMEEMTPSQSLEVIEFPAAVQVLALNTPAEMPEHPAWRREFFGGAVEILQQYSTRSYQAGVGQAAVSPSNQVALHDVISSLPRRAVESPEVLIFGSPREFDPTDEENNTVTRFPNDAFLGLPVEQSRFGTVGLTGRLDGMRVHVCLIDDEYVDPRHPDMLERFTALRIDAMGGVLASWTDDVHECVRRAQAGRDDGRRAFTRNQTDDTPTYYEIENVVLTAPVDLSRQLDLLDELPVDTRIRQQIAADIETGVTTLVSVNLFDTDHEDGDVVEIRADGLAFRVHLRNAPQRVVLPIQEGHVTMVGIADGNGGITVGIETEDGSRSLTPVMRVGEIVEVPFFIQ
ncbi:MAG: hypothetical protein AAF636_22290 [Pseudomonadota bacterium]